ncbi:MAG: TolC family protein [Armatimonadetes bacterium]|nr:TolC family protein [Armatimonadota bacterium]
MTCSALCSAADDRLGPPTPSHRVNVAAAAPSADAAPQGAAVSAAPAADPFAGFPRADGPLTREGAVQLALQHSPVLAAAQADVQMAAAMLAAARARLAPMLSLNGWASYGDAAMITRNAEAVAPASYRMLPAGPAVDANLMFMLPLDLNGRLQSQVAAQREGRRASEADLAGARLELAFTVRTLYRRIGLGRATVDVYRELAATSEERLKNTRSMADEGKVPQFYVYRDEAALADARQMQTNAERDVRVMLAELKALLGVHPLSDVQVDGKLEEEAYDLARDAALAEAVRRRPDLAAVRARVAAAGHDVRTAAAAFKPEVGVFGMADLEANRMPRSEEFLAGLSVSLPLLDGGMRQAEVRRARAAKSRLTFLETDLLLRAGREVVAADENRAAARQNLDTAEAALVSAREDYRVAQSRYAAGKGINVEVQDALTAQVRAETNYLAALYELGNAQDELRRATGDVVLTSTKVE